MKENSEAVDDAPALLPDDPAARQFQSFFANFMTAVDAGRVPKVYAPDAYLNDTIKTLHGAEAIDDYFRKTVGSVQQMDVHFEDVARSGDNYYFRWTMDITAVRLNGGSPVRSKGMTHIRFNEEGQVLLHQDYWDSSSGLFEHLPGLGSLLRWVKGRL